MGLGLGLRLGSGFWGPGSANLAVLDDALRPCRAPSAQVARREHARAVCGRLGSLARVWGGAEWGGVGVGWVGG